MRANLISIGTSKAVVLPEDFVRKLTALTPDVDAVELTIEGGQVILEPFQEVRKGWRQQLIDAIEKHGNVSDDEI